MEYMGLGDGCWQHPSPRVVKHCLGDGFCRLLCMCVCVFLQVFDVESIRRGDGLG